MNLLADTSPTTVIWSVVGAIAVLTIFFKAVGWLERRFGKDQTTAAMGVKGVLNKRTHVNVHTSSGEIFEDVRILGYTSSSPGKGAVPWEFNGMVILEHRDGRRVLISAKRVRMIEIAAPGDAP